MVKTMTNKLQYLKDYLEKYFDEMLIKDIQLIKNGDLHFTYPYVLLVSAGIDFLGGLEEGFKNDNSKQRFKNFIENWMSKVNELYEAPGMSNILYVACRCGASHEGMYKAGVEASSWSYRRDKHLKHMIDFQGKNKIFIHALQLVDDFIKAYELYKTHLQSNPDNAYENLRQLITSHPIQEVSDAIAHLKGQGLTFDAKQEAKDNPEVQDFDPNTYGIKRNDGLETTASALLNSESSISTTSTSQQRSGYDTHITSIPDPEEFEDEE
jgi:hypothetical protein